MLAYTTVKCVKIRNWKLGVRPSTPFSVVLLTITLKSITANNLPHAHSHPARPLPVVGTTIHLPLVTAFRPAADDALHVSVWNLLLRYAPRCQHSCVPWVGPDHLVFVDSMLCAISLLALMCTRHPEHCFPVSELHLAHSIRHHNCSHSRRHMHNTVVVYAVLLERGFMFKEQIVGGSLTLNSQAPRPSNLYTMANGTNATYCCDSTVPDDCPANSTSILPCAFWDEYQTEYPPSAGSVLAISTRVTVTTQTAPPTCDYQNWGPECVFTDDSEPVAQFINGAEDYTIRVSTLSSCTLHTIFVNRCAINTCMSPHC